MARTSFHLGLISEKILIIHVLDFLAGWNWFSCDKFFPPRFDWFIKLLSCVFALLSLIHLELEHVFWFSSFPKVFGLSYFSDKFSPSDFSIFSKYFLCVIDHFPLVPICCVPVKVWLSDQWVGGAVVGRWQWGKSLPYSGTDGQWGGDTMALPHSVRYEWIQPLLWGDHQNQGIWIPKAEVEVGGAVGVNNIKIEQTMVNTKYYI